MRKVSSRIILAKHFVTCSAGLFLIFGRIEAGWVDPDSPREARSTKALTNGDNRQYELVSSLQSKDQRCIV